MAKQDALSIFLSDGTTEDTLRESYAEIVDMIQKSAISSQIKNVNLSGDPESGSVEVRRLMTAASQAYGTARTAGAGDEVSNNGVTINLDQDKEIVEEVEWKDIQFYGIGDILSKRRLNHQLAMVRELDTAFFTEAEAEGSEETITSSTIEDQIEELIQSVETVSNDNVDGVDRDMLVLSVTPQVYGELRNYIDSLPNPLNGGVDHKVFHDVKIFSNTRQTKDAICMAIGAVAQPVVAQPYEVERIPLSNSIAIELYYSYGTQAVMSDLIKYASLSAVSA
jgi:hypothetical protein